MTADYNRFWAAVAVLAETFRNDDPQIEGNMLGLAEHLRSLPSEEQAAIRVDLQLLLAHFTKLPRALATPHDHFVKLDHAHAGSTLERH